MIKIFLASNNEDKILEFSRILSPLGIKIITPSDLSLNLSAPPETGKTFSENAWQKVVFWSHQTSLPILADDSGLCIYALGGLPGINSHRFISGSDHDRNLHILKLLEKYEDKEDRAAYYICLLAFFDPLSGQKLTAEGRCYGSIGFEETGNNGFGYDPIFIPTGYSYSLGILPPTIKDTISHRTKAIENIVPHLREWIK